MTAPAKFAKKPIAIEAVRWDGDNLDEVRQFCPELRVSPGNHRVLYLATLEGDFEFVPSTWIIKGVKGEFYPCRGDIFEETYEQVAEYDPLSDFF